MEVPILSFCIPVYNQVDMIERVVKQILQYPGDDIEIVISDDCSYEDIKGMLEKIGDDRIKYFRNDSNLGHDLNIISSFKRAKGMYGFLLRTRDGVMPDSIRDIIKILKEEQSISYLTGEAVDEESRWKIRYSESKRIIEKNECLKAHYSLYVHPSGSIYNIKLLNLDNIEQFLKQNIETKFSFIVHNLFRVTLSMYGNFYVLKMPTWIYTNTEKSKDVAVNRMPNGFSVYSSELIIKRYNAECEWIKQIMAHETDLLRYALIHLFKEYLYQITWGQRRRNRNPGIIAHYQIVPTKTNVGSDAKRLYNLSCEHMANVPLKQEDIMMIKREMNRIIFNNRIYGRFRYHMACMLDTLHIKPIIDTWRRKHENKY